MASFATEMKNGEDKITVTFEFPDDKAILGLQALDKFRSDEEFVNKIAMHVLYEFKDDPSVAEMLKRSGLDIIGGEDQEDW